MLEKDPPVGSEPATGSHAGTEASEKFVALDSGHMPSGKVSVKTMADPSTYSLTRTVKVNVAMPPAAKEVGLTLFCIAMSSAVTV